MNITHFEGLLTMVAEIQFVEGEAMLDEVALHLGIHSFAHHQWGGSECPGATP